MKTISMFFLLMCSVLFCFSQDTTTYKSVKLGDDWWTTADLVVDGKSKHTWSNGIPCPKGWHVPEFKDFKNLKKVAKANGWQMSDFLIGGKSGLQLEENTYYWCTRFAGTYTLSSLGTVAVDTYNAFVSFFINKNKLDYQALRSTVELPVRLIKVKAEK